MLKTLGKTHTVMPNNEKLPVLPEIYKGNNVTEESSW